MSFSAGEYDDGAIEGLNLWAKEELLKDAEHIRGDVLRLVHELLRVLVKRDQAANRQFRADGAPKHGYLPYYVLTDILAAPVKQGHLRTWSVMLVEETMPGRQGKGRLWANIPVPDDIVDLEDYDIDQLPQPELIYLARLDENGELSRYELTPHYLLHYSNGADTGQESTHEEDDIWRGVLDRLMARVDSRLPVVAQLQEDLINMKAVPQRYSPIGEPHALDE